MAGLENGAELGGERSNEDEVEDELVAVDDEEWEREPGEFGSGGEGRGELISIAPWARGGRRAGPEPELDRLTSSASAREASKSQGRPK